MPAPAALRGLRLAVPTTQAGTAPVGLMVAAANGSDRRVLAIGMAIEDLLGG
ncbi:amidase [Bordetella pertussis]|nr:amidase [Bordetella pertussis]